MGKTEDKDFRRAMSDSTNYDYFIFVNFESYFLVKLFLIDYTKDFWGCFIWLFWVELIGLKALIIFNFG